MRYLVIGWMMLGVALPALAQTYPSNQPYGSQPQNQQVSGNYYPGVPSSAPQAAPKPQPYPQHSQQPAQAAPQPQPWDYGQSVTTDVRQMNF